MQHLSRTTVAVGAGMVSLAVTAVPSLVLWLFVDLPERVATHWGADAAPDAWSPIGAALLFAPLFGGGMALIMLALGWVTRSLGVLAPVSVGLAAMLTIVGTGTVYAQRDGVVPAVGPYVFAGTVALLLVSALGVWWLRGRMAPFPAAETGTFTPASPGHPDERSWHGRIRSSLTLWILAGVLTVTGIAVGIWVGVADPWGGAAIALLTLACVPLFLLTVQDVVVDERGVTTHWFGMRVLHFPLDQIVSAGSVRLDALGDYGGVGWRSSIDGRREGIVAGTGEALILQLEGRRDYVLSVDDAHRAARVLMALLER